MTSSKLFVVWRMNSGLFVENRDKTPSF